MRIGEQVRVHTQRCTGGGECVSEVNASGSADCVQSARMSVSASGVGRVQEHASGKRARHARTRV